MFHAKDANSVIQATFGNKKWSYCTLQSTYGTGKRTVCTTQIFWQKEETKENIGIWQPAQNSTGVMLIGSRKDRTEDFSGYGIVGQWICPQPARKKKCRSYTMRMNNHKKLDNESTSDCIVSMWTDVCENRNKELDTERTVLFKPSRVLKSFHILLQLSRIFLRRPSSAAVIRIHWSHHKPQ